MINKKTVQLSVVLNERVYDDVKKLAIKKRTSMGNIIRSFIIKGLTVESHDENKEDFRRMIHDEMTEVFKQEVERLIKLQVKSTKEMIMLPKMKSIINDYYSGARSAAEMFDSKETDNGKSEIDRKMRKAAGDLYNRLGNIILKSMLRTLKENNEQRKKDNAEINTKITVDSMVYALNAVSRLFRTQGSAGTVNTAHALIGELSKQAKKDIARQKQDKGHEV